MIHHKAKIFSICGCAKLEDKLPDAKAQWWDRNGIRVIGISIPKREKMKGRKESLAKSNLKIHVGKFH